MSGATPKICIVPSVPGVALRERAYVSDEIHQDLAGRVEYDVMRRSIDFE
jgi:hypothetical protein